MKYLCFSVTFLDQRFHGRGEDGEPEWPPSPLRLMQALVAAASGRWNERRTLGHAVPALQWLETLPAPDIIAAAANRAVRPYRLYVPDNTADLGVTAWSRGRAASGPYKRTEKDVLPILINGDTVHYIHELGPGFPEREAFLEILKKTARSITHLGWGIDMATGDAALIAADEARRLPGIRWRPSIHGGTRLRVPKAGTLDDLMRKHGEFLGRIGKDGFRPVPPLRVFDMTRYRPENELVSRPYRLFELRNLDGSRFRYSHRRLIHIAGMVRHVAIKAMENAPPRNVDDDWVERYIAGHAPRGEHDHRQLAYLPLPSIGHEHADPGVRRVIIAAPPGDEPWLDHVARRLAGQPLRPLHGNEFDENNPPMLVPFQNDSVANAYTQPANVWHSFTPIILPGHDDQKPAKTKALIIKALHQSGIEQPCDFEWSAFSRFRKSYSTHKYDKNKQPQGYYRPGYLLSQTAVHLTLTFKDGLKVPGPLAIGAGRHCGLGLMATIRGPS